MEQLTDIVIIGAGPAGLSAAVNALSRGKTVRVLGNEHNYLEKAEQVDNYLGFFEVTGKTLMDQYHSHARDMGIVVEHGKVTNILPLKDQFVLSFGNDIVTGKTVILALGVAKGKELPGESRLLGNGVSYCATCDGMLYRGKTAVVSAQADNSVEEANFLHSIGVKVVFVGKNKKDEELHPEIVFIQGSVKEIRGEDRVSSVLVKHTEKWTAPKGSQEGENMEEIETDVVFLLRNSLAPTSLVPNLETEEGFINVNRFMETNIPGLFACGDCTGGYLQVSKAVGEGLVAAQQAAKWIDQQKVK